MVDRRSKKRRAKLMGSHQRCWLWGRHLVLETLRAGRWPVLELRMADRLDPADRDEVKRWADSRGVAVKTETSDRLSQLCGATEHQGLLAKMPPFPYTPVDELSSSNVTGPPPLLAVLDGIQDPHNFGAIVRSAEVLGVQGIAVGTHQQCDVTAAVARASAGAVNYLPIAEVDDLGAYLDRMKAAGLQIVGTQAKASRGVSECDFMQPTAVVIGSEAEGMRASIRERCDLLVSVPQSGQVASLNAAVAAGILFYEARRQRGPLSVEILRR